MNSDSVAITSLATNEPDFLSRLNKSLDREMIVAADVLEVVNEILLAVRERGDEAVLEYVRRFDGTSAARISELVVNRQQMQDALDDLPKVEQQALQHAAERIRAYHEKQRQSSWHYEEADGSVYGQKVSALDRVGIYIPGGKANYPSSMLMLAIPAQVAGVKEIIAVVPTAYSPQGGDQNLVFAAGAVAGVEKIFTVGGAQAIAALAYGTASIPRVDKIAGPGNVYVTAAKKLVFGEVGIDMLAGPSELTVICDGQTNPDWIAMDLFSQAEHDEQAQSILISPDREFISAVHASINRLLPSMPRRNIIRISLEQRGIFIHCESLEQAVHVSNHIAPEHLELSVADPEALLPVIENAGAIFMGRSSAEALGDYCAGPSHVLPTSGTARYFSALGVYDFQKRSSIIYCSPSGADLLSRTAATLARKESLPAHALSAEFRRQDAD